VEKYSREKANKRKKKGRKNIEPRVVDPSSIRKAPNHENARGR
jgi:hypothetical protein